MNRSASLDWFRGVAILAVLWYHSGLPGLPGAYLFIDTFFVISGFLITRSFSRLHERQVAASGMLAGDGLGLFAKDEAFHSTKMYLTACKHFLAARVRRVLIPLCTIVLITLFMAWLLMLPHDLQALAESSIMTVFLSANIYAISLGDYFEALSGAVPLLHAWSLSLEEQFYLLTPFLLVPLFYFGRIRLFQTIILGTIAYSLSAAEFMNYSVSSASNGYYLFSARLWEYAVGMLLASISLQGIRLPKKLEAPASFLALGLVFLSVLSLTDSSPSPGIITIPCILGIGLFLMARNESALIRILTSSSWLQSLGRKIYSVYLGHYPVIVFLDYTDAPLGPSPEISKFLLSLLVGILLFHCVERPYSSWTRVNFRTLALVILFLLASILVLSSYIISESGSFGRLPQEAQERYASKFLVNPNRSRCMEGELTDSGYSCSMGPEGKPIIAIVGDSHSDAIANDFSHRVEDLGFQTSHYWYAECPAIGSQLYSLKTFSRDCERLSSEAHQILLGEPRLHAVFYVVRWDWYLGAATDSERAYWRDASGHPGDYPDFQNYLEQMREVLRRSIEAFTRDGVQVYLLGPIPTQGFDPVREASLDAWYRPDWWSSRRRELTQVEDYSSSVLAFEGFVRELVEGTDVQIIMPGPALCDDLECRAEFLDQPIYYDAHHLNELGSRLLLEQVFDRECCGRLDLSIAD